MKTRDIGSTEQIMVMDNAAETIISASKLLSTFGGLAKNSQIVLFDADPFQGMMLADVQTLLVLGHANSHVYGTHSAQRFSASFVEHFERKFPREEDKAIVEHLCLIGCESDLVNDESFAQAVANELVKAGFVNLQVHAISKPDHTIDSAMFIDVNKKNDGAYKEGYLNAYLLSKKKMQALQDLSHHKNKNAQQIAEIKNKAFYFLKNTNPAVELSKPYNTFIPNEDMTTRQKRIMAEQFSHVQEDRQKAIDLLKKRAGYAKSKGKHTLPQQLGLLIQMIQRAKANEWHYPIKNNLDHFKSFLGKGKTYQMLCALAEKKLTDANAICNDKKKRHSSSGRCQSTLKRNLTAPVNRLFTAAKDKLVKSETSPLLSSHEKKRDEAIPAALNQQPLGEVKQKLACLSAVLKEEIHELQASCFSFFHQYEIRTKQEKINALEKLSECNDIDALQTATSSAMTNSRVVRSWKTNRTRDLLNEIQIIPHVNLQR